MVNILTKFPDLRVSFRMFSLEYMLLTLNKSDMRGGRVSPKGPKLVSPKGPKLHYIIYESSLRGDNCLQFFGILIFLWFSPNSISYTNGVTLAVPNLVFPLNSSVNFLPRNKLKKWGNKTKYLDNLSLFPNNWSRFSDSKFKPYTTIQNTHLDQAY